MAKYERLRDKVTVASIRDPFYSGFKPVDPTFDFPSWVWPYIQRAVKAGKLKIKLTRGAIKFSVPANADINDYPLPVIGFIQKAGITFPNITLAELPDTFFTDFKEAKDSKFMDQYGKVVNPEDLDNIPRPLWPYVRVTGRLGAFLVKVGKVDPENPREFPPGLWPFI